MGHLEWDLNDWKWDGDLFIATPLKAAQSDCRGKQLYPTNGTVSSGMLSCAGEAEIGLSGRGRDELEKKRRVVVMEEEEGGGRGCPLALKLGGAYLATGVADCDVRAGYNSKRSKVSAGNANRGMCQVEGCGADLSEAKDYHRRHKVCEMHAKASRAVVGNAVQRFCQQCSRFHLLQEFDEGKRSCRRRLAGHNKRRRKTHPENVGNESSLSNDQASSYLLISLLRILSNLQSNGSGQSKDQDLLCHLLKGLANLAGSLDARNVCTVLQASQDQRKFENCAGPSSVMQPIISKLLATNEIPNALNVQDVPDTDGRIESVVQRAETNVERSKMKNFDLNDVYNDEPDGMGEPEQIEKSTNLGTSSPNCPLWFLQECHQPSPPQMSGPSNSQSFESHSSSNGDAQSRTDRIVFKLFGKYPNDFPLDLRKQILGWLSSTPSDVEGYIRPGCIILTLYLRLSESTWKELSSDLSSSLRKLLDVASSAFWQTGWIYVRMQQQMAFIYNGHLLLDAPLLLSCHSHHSIWSVSPLAASVSGKVNFTVKGFNLVRSTLRLLCSFEGKYLVEEATQCLISETAATNYNDVLQCLNFSCSVPRTSGRGFIEVEDQGHSGAFFPFIVAETDICTEICTLESAIDLTCSSNMLDEESTEMKSRARALNFLHEMGWLLWRLQVISKVEDGDACSDLFPLMRFKWLLEFAMDHDWCAIVKKLLDTLVGGFVDTSECTVECALSEIAPLHRAVQNNSRSMVELLLRYKPNTTVASHKPKIGMVSCGFLFGPDVVATYGVTPLHIAVSRGDALEVLDALTDDPKQVGIMAWKTVHDASGFTPEDYARSRGFDYYLKLVDKKISERSNAGHVVLDISTGNSTSLHLVPEEIDSVGTSKHSGFEIDKMAPVPIQQSHCKICSKQELTYITRRKSSLLYRPAMLAMVGIATVCVCVGLLLKGPPEVVYILPPFRWESLDYGPM